MTTLRWGILSTANIATEKVIPGIQRAARCEVVAIASRDGGRARRVARPARHPAGPRLVRGAARRPGRRRRLHPAAEPPPRRVDDRRRPRRQARPVREAAGADRRRRGADGRRLRGRGRPADGGVHVPPPPVLGRGPRARRVAAGSGALTAVQSWFSYYNDDPANIRNIREVGGGALYDIGCYCVNLSRMLFGGEPVRVEASPRSRDPATGVDILTSALLEFERRRRDVHLLDPDRDRPARPRLRHRRPDLDRDPVQHPARPADARSSSPPAAIRRSRRRPRRSRSRPPTRTRSRPSASPRRSWTARRCRSRPTDAVANLRVIERIFAAADGALRPGAT